MTKIVGVRPDKMNRMLFFDAAGLELVQGDYAVFMTEQGPEIGKVITSVRELRDDSKISSLRPLQRKAGDQDMERLEKNREKEKEAFSAAEEKIQVLGLDMKLINVDCSFDGSRIVFYFTAEGRVDFRELVKELAQIFKTRIELRQIGVRDEAKLIGGLGPCGRPACCASFLTDFSPVSIKMAKDQNLSLSPTKISGLCGRLMCCLNFENEYYEETRKLLPRTGAEVLTPDGDGTVTEVNILTEKVKVRITLPDGSADVREYPNSELTVVKAQGARRKDAPQKQKNRDGSDGREEG